MRQAGPLVVALFLALIIACGGNGPDSENPGSDQVRGMVVEVAGRNIVELESLRIRDESGKEWTFGADQGFIGFTPSHLREHQLVGESVLVSYITRGGQLVVVDISD